MASKKKPDGVSTTTTLGTVLFTICNSVNQGAAKFADLDEDERDQWEQAASIFGGFIAAYADHVMHLIEPVEVDPRLTFGSN